MAGGAVIKLFCSQVCSVKTFNLLAAKLDDMNRSKSSQQSVAVSNAAWHRAWVANCFGSRAASRSPKLAEGRTF